MGSLPSGRRGRAQPADRYELRFEQPWGTRIRERYYFATLAIQTAKVLFERHYVTSVQVIRISDEAVIFDPAERRHSASAEVAGGIP
jgi:hypothetical protein